MSIEQYSIESSILNCTFAFLWGCTADVVLPGYSEDKKPMVQLFEIALQIALFYLALIYIPSIVARFAKDDRGGRFLDKLVVIVILIGTQLTLLKKIDGFKETLIGLIFNTPRAEQPKSSIVDEALEEEGATSLEALDTTPVR